MTMIETELRKWKRNKIVWGILALTILLAGDPGKLCVIDRNR